MTFFSFRTFATIAICTTVASAAFAHSDKITRQNFQAKLDECNAGNGNTCQALGGLFRSSNSAKEAGQRVNFDMALQFYERGCALGDTGACGSVNRVYGDPKYKGYDPARALPYFAERCQRRGKDSNDCKRVQRLQKDMK